MFRNRDGRRHGIGPPMFLCFVLISENDAMEITGCTIDLFWE
jgi:hypothetical protein